MCVCAYVCVKSIEILIKNESKILPEQLTNNIIYALLFLNFMLPKAAFI